MGWNVLPAGTMVVRLPAEAAVTVAFTPPKKMMLFAAMLLKPVPVIVTAVPTGPVDELKEEIFGCAEAVVTVSRTSVQAAVRKDDNDMAVFYRQ